MSRQSTEIKNISYDDVRGKYYVTLNYGYENGKQVKKTKTASNKTEAKKILKEFEADKTKGELTMPRTDTVADWLNYWMESAVKSNREKTTYAGYRIIIDKHIIPQIGNIQLQKLTPKIIQTFYSDELNKATEEGQPLLSSNTVKKHHTLLKTALKFAVMQDAIRYNPCDKVSPPKYVKPEISFYTIDYLKELFNLVETDYILKPAVYLAGMLGLRREEIAGLRWEHIDFNKSIIYITEVRAVANKNVVIKQTKNQSSTRCLSFNDNLNTALLDIMKIHKENKQLFYDSSDALSPIESCVLKDYVVVNELNQPIHPGYLSTLFGRFIRKNKLPHVTLHGLRHTMASVGNAAGLTLFDISKILGHSSPDVTGKIYTHLFDNTQKESIAKIQNKLI